MKSKERKLLIVKAKGGMGNRMLCAATGIAYGLLSDRQVAIDWTDESYSNNGENSFLRYFNAPAVTTCNDFVKNNTFPKVWAEHLNWSVSRMIHAYDPDKHSSFRIHRKYSLNPKILDYHEDTVILWTYTHRINDLQYVIKKQYNELWCNSVDGILKKLFNIHIQLKPEIQQRIDNFRENMFNNKVIGVHVRHSDRSANVDRYLKEVKKIYNDNEDSVVFLATDNQTVLESFRSQFPTLISTEKWYPDAGVSMHQNASCPDVYENGVEALIDMYLLSFCNWLIYPKGSTFSYISSILSSAPKENIIDMDRFNIRVRAARILRSVLN